MTDVPFFRVKLDENEVKSVVDVLESGWLTTGKVCQTFEADFADFLGAGVEAVAVNSATAALHLGLEAMGIGPGDEVICPTMTFTATAEVIRYVGADPVFVDCDERTLCITPDLVSPAITDRTRAIMPVHFAGLPCDMSGFNDLAQRHNLKILDDAAHALPAKAGNQLIGTVGTNATAFSFYANKTMTTGEGGMLVSNDPEILKRARQMRLHGIDRDAFDRFKVGGSWRYDIVAPGYKYNMTDIAAALGRHQLRKVSGFRETRRALVARYDEFLKGLPLISPAHGETDESHSWHLYIIRLTPEAPMDRDTLITALTQAGIGTSVHYMPLHKMTYWKELYGLREDDFPNAEAAFGNMLSLPLFMDMKNEEQDYVIRALHRLLGEVDKVL
jgi:dTDP-4-amino-4,6-dideoxygalactose transaminase